MNVWNWQMICTGTLDPECGKLSRFDTTNKKCGSVFLVTILLKVQEIMLRVPIIPYRPMDMPKHIAE